MGVPATIKSALSVRPPGTSGKAAASNQRPPLKSAANDSP